MREQKNYGKSILVHLAMKKNELLIHSTSVNLENTILSERSQTDKKYIYYEFIYMKFKNRKN